MNLVPEVEQFKEPSCIVIPRTDANLLLPDVCIAEIVPWTQTPLSNDSVWGCLGSIQWREHTLPVVHDLNFSSAGQKSAAIPLAAQTPDCLVILNRTQSTAGPAFYALTATGLPYLLSQVNIVLDETLGEPRPADQARVRIGDQQAIIPNLTYVEGKLAELC